MNDVGSFSRSFAAGEITPELYSRPDLTKFQTGLALCLNFIILPHGPAANRAGFEYVLQAKDSTRAARLVPVVYSDIDTFMLEVGHLYIRFHTQGETLVETAKVITGLSTAASAIVTSVAHGYATGQAFFLEAVGGPTALNGRFFRVGATTANTFALQDLNGTAISTIGMPAYTAGGTAKRVYEIVTPYSADDIDLLDIHYAQSTSVLTFTHRNYPTKELVRTAPIVWQLNDLDIDPPLDPPTTGLVANVTGSVGADGRTEVYGVTSVDDNGVESFISAPVAAVNELWKQMNYTEINWDLVIGANRYNVYKRRGGLFSYIGQATGGPFRDDNIVADTSQTPPEPSNPFNGTGLYPGTVTYDEQRRIFAGSTLKPTNVWMTRSGTDSNFTSSIPTRDDDSIAFRLAAREYNSIRHVLPLDELVLLTASAAWKVIAKNSDALTPSSISAKPSTYIGASMVQPVVASNSILYIAAKGSHLLELKYSWEVNGHLVSDISVMAPHLFDGLTVQDLAWQQAPFKCAWMTRSDGTLLGMTYVPEQQVQALHQHTTVGEFESCASVVEESEDRLYAIVRRVVNGHTVRYIERMHQRIANSLPDAFFVDAGKSYDGAPTQTVHGLEHLEGATVAILVDGAVHAQRVVAGGAVTLDVPGSLIHIGLPYNADLQTLPQVIAVSDGGQTVYKNVATATARVYQSSSIAIGPSFDQLVEYKQRTDESYDTVPRPITGNVRVQLLPDWTADGQVCIRQSNPLPLTVLSIGLGGAVGE